MSYMRVPGMPEQLQQIVNISDINLYHVDGNFHPVEQYVYSENESTMSADSEKALIQILGEDTYDSPILYETEEGELYGVILVAQDSIYLTSGVPADKMVKMLSYLEVIDRILFGRITYQKDILIRHGRNYNTSESKVEDMIELEKSQGNYHSYRDERIFTNAIERGDKALVREYLEKGFVQTFRKSSSDPLTHYRNVCITSITLASRAAIRGGVSALLAYDFANTIMKQVDKTQTAGELYTMICGVFNRFTQMVADEKERHVPNNIVEQCMQYVIAHYKDPVKVNDIADHLGKNPNYISSLFKEQTGKSLKSYINAEKIAAAKDMLKYSDYEVSFISNFLSFNSQAYFGKVFKEFAGMTPKKYRDKHRVKELSFETGLK